MIEKDVITFEDLQKDLHRVHLENIRKQGVLYLGTEESLTIPATVLDAWLVWVTRRVAFWAEKKGEVEWRGANKDLFDSWLLCEDALCEVDLMHPSTEYLEVIQRRRPFYLREIENFIDKNFIHNSQTAFFSWPWEPPLVAGVKTRAYAYFQALLDHVHYLLSPDLITRDDRIKSLAHVIKQAYFFVGYLRSYDVDFQSIDPFEKTWQDQSLYEMYRAIQVTGKNGMKILRAQKLASAWGFPDYSHWSWDEEMKISSFQPLSMKGCKRDITEISSIQNRKMRCGRIHKSLTEIPRGILSPHYEDNFVPSHYDKVPLPEQTILMRQDNHYIPLPNLVGAYDIDWDLVDQDAFLSPEFYSTQEDITFSKLVEWKGINPKSMREKRTKIQAIKVCEMAMRKALSGDEEGAKRMLDAAGIPEAPKPVEEPTIILTGVH